MSKMLPSQCSVCSVLGDFQYGFQKGGRDEDNSFIHPISDKLEEIEDRGSSGSREHKILRCPQCGTWYQYDTDYEFLVNGTEDEQTLRRMAPAEVYSRYGKKQYETLTAYLRNIVENPDPEISPEDRAYAIRSIVGECVRCQDAGSLESFLFSPKKEILDQTLAYLRDFLDNYYNKKKVLFAKDLFLRLKNTHAEERVRYLAASFLR